MKKKIIIGSSIVVFILLMLPSISAVEFNTAMETNKTQILEQIRNIDINNLKEKLKTNNFPMIMYILTFLSELIFKLSFILDLIYIPFLFLAFFLLWIKGVTISPMDINKA